MKSDTVSAPPHSALRRWLPLAGLGLAAVVAYGLGLHHYLTLQALAEHQQALEAAVAAHLGVSLAVYFIIYVVVVALSFPGAGFLSIVGGFVFGWALSAPITIIAATLGAVGVFKIVQTSFGQALTQRAGPFVQRLSQGFERDAFNYLLFLRLVPAFPFFAVNVVAGLTRTSLRVFTLGTLIGIIPGAYAFAFLGRGLGSVLDMAQQAHAACVAQNAAAVCGYDIAASALITPELLWGFAALGAVSLLPVMIRQWRGK